MADVRYFHLFYLKPEDEFLDFKKDFLYHEGNKRNTPYPYLDENLFVCEVKRSNQKILNMLRNAKDNSFLILNNIDDIFDSNFSDMEEIISILKIKELHIRIIKPTYIKMSLADPFHLMLFETILARINMSSIEWIEQQKKIQLEQEKEKQRQLKADKFNEKQNAVPVKYAKLDRLIEKNKAFTDLDIQIMRRNRKAHYSYVEIAKKFNCTTETVKYFTKEIKVKKELVNIKPVQILKHDVINNVLKDKSEINLVFKKYLCRYTNVASREPIQNRLLKYFEYIKAKNNNVLIISFDEVSTVNVVSNYLEYKKEQYTNDNQIRNIYLNLSGFFRYCVENEYIFENPIKKIIPPKIDNSVIRTKHLSTEELSSVIKFVASKYLEQSKTLQINTLFRFMRNTIFMLIIIYTGMRISEVINLRKENIVIDDNDNSMYIKTIGKNNRIIQRDLPDNLSAIIKKYFELYKNNMAEDRFIFTKRIESDEQIQSFRANIIVKYFVAAAGINKKISAHSFRTTFAIQSIKNGMPIYELQRRMGHTNVNQTIAYAKTLEASKKNTYLSKSVLEGEELLAKALHNFDDLKLNLTTAKKDIKNARKSVFFRKSQINEATS